ARRGHAPERRRGPAPAARPGLARPGDQPAARPRTRTRAPGAAAAAPRRPRRPGRLYQLTVADAVEARAFAAEPEPGRPGIGAQQARDQSMEFLAVVEMDEVGDLVGDGGAADVLGREDQPPGIADRALRRAAAPARHRVADAHA